MRPAASVAAIGFTAILGVAAISQVAKLENHRLAYYATDGDTLRASNGERIRLLRIDAPEMPHSIRNCQRVHCPTGDPYASRDALQWALSRGTVQCAGSGHDIYGRRLAECFVTAPNGTTVNVNDWMMASGFAQPYRRH